jgi:biotin synthase
MNFTQLSLLRASACAGGCQFCGLSIGSEVDRASATEADFRAAYFRAREANARLELVFPSVGADQREVLGLLRDMAEVIREYPDVELCVNPGICTRSEFFSELVALGVCRYRNNLETSRRLFRELVPGRPLAQGAKLESLALARKAGLCVDTGWLCGLGENESDTRDILALLEVSAPDSIALNFFDPRESAEAFAHTKPCNGTGLARLRVLRERFPSVEITLGGAYELWLGADASRLSQADGVYVGGFLDHGLQAAQSPAHAGAGLVRIGNVPIRQSRE